jgi:hypothetical protein
MTGGSSPGRGWEFFSSLTRPDRLWGLLSLLSYWNQGLFHWGLGGRDRSWPFTSHLVPRSRMRGAIPLFPQYAFMAWWSVKSTGIKLPFLPLHVQQRGNYFGHLFAKSVTGDVFFCFRWSERRKGRAHTISGQKVQWRMLLQASWEGVSHSIRARVVQKRVVAFRLQQNSKMIQLARNWTKGLVTKQSLVTLMTTVIELRTWLKKGFYCTCYQAPKVAFISPANRGLGYRLEDRTSRARFPAGGWQFFSLSPLPERLWGPPSLLSNG